MPYKNKEDRRQHFRERWKNDPEFRERRMRHNKISMRKRRKKRKLQAVEYLGGKCERCGYDKIKEILEFHHTDLSQKDSNVSLLLLRSWERLKEELDKTILVCPTCHAEIHYLGM